MKFIAIFEGAAAIFWPGSSRPLQGGSVFRSEKADVEPYFTTADAINKVLTDGFVLGHILDPHKVTAMSLAVPPCVFPSHVCAGRIQTHFMLPRPLKRPEARRPF